MRRRRVCGTRRALLLCISALLLRTPAAGSAPSPPEPALDRFLRRAADILTDMDGPIGRVYFPAIATNPNAGPTVGVLPVWLLTNENKEIEHIFAPMLTYNQTFGPALQGSYYYYPSGRTQMRVLLEKAAVSNYRAHVRLESHEFLDERCVLRIDLNHQADGTPRFFGFGPGSSKGGEASYRLLERLARAEMGIKYWGTWQMSFSWMYRQTEVVSGPVQAPADLDPRLKTVSTYSNPKFGLFRDTRDLPSTPSRGSFSEVFVEFSETALGSVSGYRHYGGQWRGYVPNTESLTSVLHVQSEWLEGGQVPFTALASLGGPRSLRGFAEGRFTDRGSLFFNLEERWTFHTLDVVNTLTEFQVAPFLDVGTVFQDMGEIQMKHLQTVVGVAFRGVVKPTVVGRVEIGASREGPVTFVGIDYPF